MDTEFWMRLAAAGWGAFFMLAVLNIRWGRRK